MIMQVDIGKFMDIPFVEGGRGYAGADCWGLVYLFYREWGRPLPEYAHYAVGINTAATLRQIQREKAQHYREISAPEYGDIVFMLHGEIESHVGVFLQKGEFMHLERGREVAVNTIRDFEWKHRILGYYRPIT